MLVVELIRIRPSCTIDTQYGKISGKMWTLLEAERLKKSNPQRYVEVKIKGGDIILSASPLCHNCNRPITEEDKLYFFQGYQIHKHCRSAFEKKRQAMAGGLG